MHFFGTRRIEHSNPNQVLLAERFTLWAMLKCTSCSVALKAIVCITKLTPIIKSWYLFIIQDKLGLNLGKKCCPVVHPKMPSSASLRRCTMPESEPGCLGCRGLVTCGREHSACSIWFSCRALWWTRETAFRSL